MHAAVITTYGSPPTYSTFADPEPREGEVAVTITAAALHRIVKALADGTHYGATGELPFIPGVDGVGRLADGKRVYFGSARSPFGTFAERGVAPQWMCTPIPDSLDDATAAAIANPAMSSWVALMRANFQPGQSLLILGATGVSGRLAVQIAKCKEARRVIAAGRHPHTLDRLRSLGADSVISLDQNKDALVAAFRSELADAGIDVVLDYVWGNPGEAFFEAVSLKGLRKATARLTYVQIGNSAAPTITLPAAVLRSSDIQILGSGFGSASMDRILRAVAEFFTLAATAPFEFERTTAPLSDVEKLWNSPQSSGRLVFVP
jgi:NADPH:quinone reductase-like Zn-dependent oxidoreductase